RNSYWYAHQVLRSRARVVYGRVYDIPAAIGPVDVSTFGSILLHLRDPFLALANAARLTRETIVVTETAPALPPPARPTWWQRLLGRGAGERPATPAAYLTFCPRAEHPMRVDTWWCFSPEIIQQFLQVLGFEQSRVSHHSQPFQGRPLPLF